MKLRYCLLACLVVAFPLFGFAKKDISDIDKNFSGNKSGISKAVYKDALKPPFKLEGFPFSDTAPLRRLPKSFTEADVNKGALWLSMHTSGGAIRFKTDSRYITIRSKLFRSYDMNHMARTGSSGFDLYMKGEDGKYLFMGAIQPSSEEVKGKETVEAKFKKTFPNKKMREFILYLPLYGGFDSLKLGFEPRSRVVAPSPRKISKPILFYGSSITQGACASKPGNNYTTLLCRAVDAPQINLGFSGSGKGEIAVAEAIASLDLAAFVFDYDANAPDVEHLMKTHEPFFKVIRKKRPNLPIIMMSMCSSPVPERTAVIKRTYDNAVASGDKKVWFIDGAELFGGLGNDLCTVDNTHPNDLGFYMMYKTVLPVLKKALSIR